MKKFCVLIFLAFSFHASSQRGKDGAGTIVASATVNLYTAVNANISAGSTTVSVASAAGISSGDLIYIIQMQGASVNCYTTAGTGTASSAPFDLTYGRITAYNNAGNNEYAQVASVSGNTITVDCALQKNYTAAGRVQVLRVPRYSALSISAGGIITCPPWNGTTGGVIAIEVNGNTTISPGGRIDASALGFRGGITTGKLTGLNGGAAFGHNNPNEGGYKGEGIAGDVLTYSVNWQGLYCRGAVANAGGGGDANNAGGGGGANGGDTSLYVGTGNPDVSVAGYVTAWNLEAPGFAGSSSSGGGRGGYSYSSASVSPTTYGPGNAAWGGGSDLRRNVGGLGGRPLDYNSGRLFAGGGGGAGDENDAYGGAGGDGGGIINLLSYGTVSGGGEIRANGENGFNTITAPLPNNNVAGRDGAGGAGGGGAIRIISSGAITNLSITANGGNGGNQRMANNLLFGQFTSMAYGPGGGGGGGYIGTTPATISAAVAGGTNGIVQYISGNENCQIDNLFPANGATRGGAGSSSVSALSAPATITASPGSSLCAGNAATLTAGTTGTGTIGWYSAAAGGTQLGAGSPFTTSVFPVAGVYTVYAGFCPGGTYRIPVTLTVVAGPTLSTSSATICPGQSATISASGASTYSWNTGPTTSTIAASPGITTVYTVSGTSGGCSSFSTATITVVPPPTIAVNSATICSGQSTTLTAGAASGYTWSTGSNNQSISVTPSATAIYTITANTGTCNATNTSTVTVNPNPTLSVSNASICSGTSTVLTASGAQTYTWSNGPNTSTVSVSPTVSTVYTVSGSSGTCSDTKTVSVNVSATPSLAVSAPSICAGQTATLAASGAVTYTWSTGSNNSSITPTPSVTTVYTVSGSNGNCTATTTATLVVAPAGSIAVNSASICSGQSATLTAGAAISYTWSMGSNAQSVAVTPSISSVYTISATAGNGCVVSNTAQVNVTLTPTLSVSSASMCSGQTVTLSASGASTYSWSNGVTTASNNVSPGSTTVYTVTGMNGSCSSSQTAAVTVSTAPSFSLNANIFNICGGQSASIIATPVAGSYSWSNGSTSSSIVVNPGVSTVYSLTVSNVCGSSAQSATVNPGAAPALTISASNTVLCPGQTITLNTAGSSGTYSWSNGGGNTPSIAVSNAGTYSAFVTNACGSATSNAIVIADGPSTALNLGSTSMTLCSGGSATLTATASGSVSWSTGAVNVPSVSISNPGVYSATVSNSCGTGTSSITVSNGPPPTLSIAPAGSFCSGQTATLNASGSAGTYSWTNGTSGSVLTTTAAGTYTAVVSNSCGVSTETFDVIFQSAPSVSVTATKTIICAGESTTLTANGMNGGATYSWSSSANTSSVEIAGLSGNYMVTYTNNCGSSTATIAIVQSTLNADFSFSPNGGSAPLMVNFSNNSSNNAANTWNFGNGQSSSNSSANSSYNSPGTYTITLSISNSEGCQASISKTLEVTGLEFSIPEIFTPNGDGKNDLFEITGIEHYPGNELQIFNRWGNLVYKTSAYRNTWDGTPNKGSGSGKLPPGTYYYILNLNNGSEPCRGFVQLMY